VTHPGTITFVDKDAGTEKVVSADQVPEGMRFGKIASGEEVPVTRVEAQLRGEERVIKELGPNGELLRTTVQRSVF
jgi:hypothetical protein